MSESINLIKDVECPHCNQKFALSEAIQKSLTQQVHGSIAQERSKMENEIKQKAEIEKNLAVSLERKKSEQALALSKSEIQAEKDELDKAIKKQKDLFTEKAQLQTQIKSFELTILEEVRAAKLVQEKATIQAMEVKSQLEKADSDRKLRRLTEQLEIATKQSRQGSQEAQGEVLEEFFQVELEKYFHFPDNVKKINKGERGADIILEVCDNNKQRLGAVLFETKRAEKWSHKWVEKLKSDLVENRADVGVIIATNLPEGVRNFAEMDGVWVADPTCGIQLAKLLRRTLADIAHEKHMQVNTTDRAQLLYRYLTSNVFKQKVSLVIGSFAGMKADLDKEKNGMMRNWAAREKKIAVMQENFVGLIGDADGLAALGNIPGLDLGEGDQENLKLEDEAK